MLKEIPKRKSLCLSIKGPAKGLVTKGPSWLKNNISKRVLRENIAPFLLSSLSSRFDSLPHQFSMIPSRQEGKVSPKNRLLTTRYEWPPQGPFSGNTCASNLERAISLWKKLPRCLSLITAIEGRAGSLFLFLVQQTSSMQLNIYIYKSFLLFLQCIFLNRTKFPPHLKKEKRWRRVFSIVKNNSMRTLEQESLHSIFFAEGGMRNGGLCIPSRTPRQSTHDR